MQLDTKKKKNTETVIRALTGIPGSFFSQMPLPRRDISVWPIRSYGMNIQLFSVEAVSLAKLLECMQLQVKKIVNFFFNCISIFVRDQCCEVSEFVV